jgi:hypothetical protein
VSVSAIQTTWNLQVNLQVNVQVECASEVGSGVGRTHMAPSPPRKFVRYVSFMGVPSFIIAGSRR